MARDDLRAALAARGGPSCAQHLLHQPPRDDRPLEVDQLVELLVHLPLGPLVQDEWPAVGALDVHPQRLALDRPRNPRAVNQMELPLEAQGSY